MRIDRLDVGLQSRRRVKAPCRKFEYRHHLFPRHVEPLHDFLYGCTGFEVLEHSRNRHTGVLKHPCTAALAGDALHSGTLRPIETRHIRIPPSLSEYGKTRSEATFSRSAEVGDPDVYQLGSGCVLGCTVAYAPRACSVHRSEEHTSELQSPCN